MFKLFKNLSGYIPGLILVFLLVCVQIFCELALPSVMKDIVNVGIVNRDINYIWLQGGIMLGFAAIGAASVILSNYVSSRISMGFGAKIRSKLFQKVTTFSLDEMSKVGTSSLITRTTNDVVQVQTTVYMILRMFLMAPFMFVGGLIFSIGIDASLTTVLLISIPGIVIAVGLVGVLVMPLFKRIQKKVDHLTVVTREGLTGIRVIRAFNQEPCEKQRFQQASGDLSKTAIKANRLMSVLMPAITIIMGFTTAGIVLVASGNINAEIAGNTMAVIQYVSQIMFSLIMVAMAFIMIPRASVSAQRINDVLKVNSNISDGANEHHTKQTTGTVEFEHVTFTFQGADQTTLEDINFVSKPGEVTAIIGSTGSGKSTVINLIPRFFDVNHTDGGRVLVNGMDVRQMKIDDLRNMIGFVPQKARLFSGTIAENLRMGKEDATLEDMEHAVTIAQASDFIHKLEHGFESRVSQGGSNFSGGQRQRLAIARALIRKPQIYIFDDSFSALDYKTDKMLRAALRSETTQSTVLIVAQRVSTIMDADRIIVLENGKVVGIGTHTQLLKDNEVYREIVLSQLEEEEVK